MQLFLTSFLILLLELSLIRLVPGYMILTGYFTNLIVIASFLGIGVGLLLWKKSPLIVYLFPLLLLALIGFLVLLRVQVAIPPSEVIFFNDPLGKFIPVQPMILIPFLYILIAFPFIPLGLLLGKYFTLYSPLKAYSLDIAGSLCGIILFSLLSFLMTSPTVWLTILSIVFLFLVATMPKVKIYLPLSCIVLISCIAILFFTNTGQTFWSPYYRISVFDNNGEGYDRSYVLDVNNIAHQYVSRYDYRQPFYYAPYQAFPNALYKKILIIGAGTGADTATALALDPAVTHIDAVEIDPKIYQLGKELNPDKPYNDSRVHIHIDDGRDFLHNSTETYDLIEYAVTDSLTLTSHSSNVRLESFIFTTDAFREVKNHLSKNGLFVMYNYYRESWLIDKLVAMQESVFGYPSRVYILAKAGNAAVIATGPKSLTLPKTSLLKPYSPQTSLPLATDEWPFLYLKEKAIPVLYATFIPILFAISLLLIGGAHALNKRFSFNYRLFFLGSAFLLLETKSLTTFSLLFGNTWIVNSVVFGGILLAVLLANILAQKMRIPQLILLFCIVLSLTSTMLLPTATLLTLPLFMRAVSAILFYFLPIFLANVSFAQYFKDTKHSQADLASNLSGAVFGGFLEYTSLALGYQLLTVLIICCYIIALFPSFKRKSV